MPADYPSSIHSFTTLTDGVDDVLASHQNEPNLEIAAIETELGTLPKGASTDVKTRLNNLSSGWIDATGTWTYASATTITVPTDATTTYQKGWGIRFKQGAGYKYMYITTVAATLLTVNGGSDYSVANAAITDVAYCPNPSGAFGFPGVHNWTVTPSRGTTPYTNLPTVNSAKFKIRGNKVEYDLQYTQHATPGGTGTVLSSLPIAIATRSIGNGFNLSLLTQFSIFHEVATSNASLFPIEANASEIYILSGIYEY